MKRRLLSYGQSIAIACLSLSAFSTSVSADEKLKSIIDGKHRTAKYAARDEFRHPYETLTFFGIKDNMTVVEMSPGGGWYTEILAPYLKDNGSYIAAGFDPESSVNYYKKNAKKFSEKVKKSPELYGKTQITIFEAPNKMDYAKDGTADMVLSFRNAHHWHRKNHAEAIYASIFKKLKPGGVFGIVQHRAGDKYPDDKKGNKGYLPEAEVIQLVKNAGFRLVEKSEVNANAKDTKDYEGGVWELLPSLGGKEKEKIKAIGESDRMTLKFVKPAEK